MYDARIHVIMSTNRIWHIYVCIIVYTYTYNIDWKPPSDLCFCWRSTLEKYRKKTILFFQTPLVWSLGAKIYRYHIYLIIDVCGCVTWYVANITRFKKHKMVIWTATPLPLHSLHFGWIPFNKTQCCKGCFFLLLPRDLEITRKNDLP